MCRPCNPCKYYTKKKLYKNEFQNGTWHFLTWNLILNRNKHEKITANNLWLLWRLIEIPYDWPLVLYIHLGNLEEFRWNLNFQLGHFPIPRVWFETLIKRFLEESIWKKIQKESNQREILLSLHTIGLVNKSHVIFQTDIYLVDTPVWRNS